jgi:hypothetical protein
VPAHPAPIFVGRLLELASLEAGLESALDGRGDVFFVSGDPGIGKTRLAGELASVATARGARVFWGRCWEGQGAPSFWPWVQILRALVRSCGTPGPDLGHLAPLLPELAGPPHGEADSDTARFRLFDAATRLLLSAAQDGPLVLLLDDLHWADAPSILLLKFLGPHVASAPILVVGTLRESEAPPELVECLPVLHPHTVPLRGLPDADVARLVRECIGVELAPDVVADVCERTEGNPFFVDELVRLLVADGTPSTDPTPITRGIREVIRRRLAPLPDETRALLRAGSVFGRTFSVGALEEVTGLGRDLIRERLRRAVDIDLVIEAALAPGEYLFAHVLVRDTLYEELGASERERRHLGAGRALEHHYGARADAHVAELAHHFFEAGADGGERALFYSFLSARKAMDQLAYEDAARHCARALATMRWVDRDGGWRFELFMLTGEAERRAGRMREAMDAFAEAAALAAGLRPQALARAAIGFEDARVAAAELIETPQSVALLRSAIDAVGGDETRRAALQSRLVRVLHPFSPSEEMLPLAREAVEIAERIGEPGLRAIALSGLWWASWVPTHAGERRALAEDWIRAADDAGDEELGIQGRLMAILDALEAGDVEAVDRRLPDYTRRVHALHQTWYEWHAGALRANRALMRGRFDVVDAELAPLRTASWTMPEAIAGLFGGVLGWERGRPDDAEASLLRVLPRVPIPSVRAAGEIFVHALHGRRDQVVRALDAFPYPSFDDIPDTTSRVPTFAVLAVGCAAAGDAARADALYTLLEPFPRRVVVLPPLPTFLTTSHWLGVLAATAGRPDDAERHFADALEMHERMGARAWLSRTRLEYGRMLAARSDHERAAYLLHLALADAEDMGQESVAAPARELLGPSFPAHDGDRVFRADGDWWTVAFDGQTVRLKELKGFHYLRRLLANPSRELHVLELVAGAGGATAAREDGLGTGSGAEAVLDPEAKSAYRRRIDELREEIDEADAFADDVRAARARAELDALEQELARALGLGGRDRRLSSEAERARINVTRALRAAIDRIARTHPRLGEHLRTLVRTGIFCCYATDPRAPVTWSV